MTLTILTVSLEGSAIFSIPRDRVAMYEHIMSTAVPSVCTRRMAGSIMLGGVGHIHIQWTRYGALVALQQESTKLTRIQKERSRYDMLYHLIHGIILNHTGTDFESEGTSYVQAVARPIVPSQTPPYSILDLGCGTGIWASDMAR